MRSFKVRDGKVMVDGILYGSSPTDTKIVGKSGSGFIHSINIEGRGQFFPINGVFNDGTIPETDDNTGIVEETAKPKRTKKVK